MLVSILAYSETMRQNVESITYAPRVAEIKALIANNDVSFRAYVPLSDKNTPYDEYLQKKYTLAPELIAVCDTYFGHALLFEQSYSNLAGDEFFSLTPERQVKALDSLVNIGTNTEKARQEMVFAFQNHRQTKRLLIRIQRTLTGITFS